MVISDFIPETKKYSRSTNDHLLFHRWCIWKKDLYKIYKNRKVVHSNHYFFSNSKISTFRPKFQIQTIFWICHKSRFDQTFTPKFQNSLCDIPFEHMKYDMHGAYKASIEHYFCKSNLWCTSVCLRHPDLMIFPNV